MLLFFRRRRRVIKKKKVKIPSKPFCWYTGMPYKKWRDVLEEQRQLLEKQRILSETTSPFDFPVHYFEHNVEGKRWVIQFVCFMFVITMLFVFWLVLSEAYLFRGLFIYPFTFKALFLYLKALFIQLIHMLY